VNTWESSLGWTFHSLLDCSWQLVKIIVPSYFYASSPLWPSLISQNLAVEYAIINPNSGPGTVKDNNYASVTAAAQARGISILGYIATTYGSKPMTGVLDEVRRYEAWYQVDGFLFDEAASGTDKIDYYASLYKSVKGVVVLNPGTYPHQAYVEVCDVLMVEERGVEVTEDRSVDLADWMKGQPPHKFGYVIYGVSTAAKMRRILTKAQQRNVGYVFVTNDTLPNPYDSLPSYWSDECALVRDLASTLSLGRS
jgi:hypothetical protein